MGMWARSLSVLSLGALLVGAGCAASVPHVASPPPPMPAPPPEIATPQPGPGYVWVPGHYTWRASHRGYVWVPGHWTVPPPGYVWVPGHWVTGPGGYVWVEGRWRPAGTG